MTPSSTPMTEKSVPLISDEAMSKFSKELESMEVTAWISHRMAAGLRCW